MTDNEASALRAACHALIQALPEAAFVEALTVLYGLREFYSTIPDIQKPMETRHE